MVLARPEDSHRKVVRGQAGARPHQPVAPRWCVDGKLESREHGAGEERRVGLYCAKLGSD